ncbi:MAG: SPOR domain-containing protein [Nitrospirota bacterium]
MDLRQPVPLRRTPEFLFGDVRRRVRSVAAVSGLALALLLGGGMWMARGDGSLRSDPPAETAPPQPVATERVSPPAADEFPLIIEPPPDGARSPGDGDETAALLQPLTEPPALHIEPPASEPATPTAPVATTPAPSSTSPAERDEPVAAVRPDPPASPTPSPAEGDASPAPPRYILQLGTYRLEESALDDQEHYRSLGIETVIQRWGPYLVLRLPPFASQEEAEREEARLRQRGITPLFIPPEGAED